MLSSGTFNTIEYLIKTIYALSLFTIPTYDILIYLR